MIILVGGLANMLTIYLINRYVHKYGLNKDSKIRFSLENMVLCFLLPFSFLVTYILLKLID